MSSFCVYKGCSFKTSSLSITNGCLASEHLWQGWLSELTWNGCGSRGGRAGRCICDVCLWPALTGNMEGSSQTWAPKTWVPCSQMRRVGGADQGKVSGFNLECHYTSRGVASWT